MSKVKRDFDCVHIGCGFKTDKRKAIVTHLIRTHSERKEDFECEYCDTLFEEETVIEEHLYRAHPGCQFRYTCVSRLENVLNKCAQLAAERRKSLNPQSEGNVSTNGSAINNENVIGPAGNETAKATSKPKKANQSETSSQKRKAIVNESLNNLAKLPKIAVPENPLTAIKQEPLDQEHDERADDDVNDFENDGEDNMFISKPSGLKIKLNLKKIRDSCSRESSTEPQNRATTQNCTSELREMSPIDDSDILQSDISVNESENLDHTKSVSPRSAIDTPATQVNKPKYHDKLEVYHTTDEMNRRCCPFCEYKTTKNTIRVHLAGKHKIYFVQCSICDFKAAFPYQVQSHGVSHHKIQNIEVLHLSKSYREGVIAKLQAGGGPDVGISNDAKPAEDRLEADLDTNTEFGQVDDIPLTVDEVCFSNDEELSQMKQSLTTDTRVFKPPVCQTSKTDYYNIVFENNTYLYCCNQCDFRTPVRATIYTHKYRHDDKAYKCSYCDFISSPRSNVVHHIRGKHKGKPFEIIETPGLEQLRLAGVDGNSQQRTDEERGPYESGDENIPSVGDNKLENLKVKQEPTVEDVTSDPWTASSVLFDQNENACLKIPQADTKKPQKTIIKVPQYKRSLTTVAVNPVSSVDGKPKIVKEASGSFGEIDYKLSLNKLYRLNPNGTPKYLCNECPYACDTHPKMKHHLYRHKPQRYKCPYCNHKKYPRSYVVRHVRDTHRDKPLRVVDLLKNGEAEDNLDESDELNDSGDTAVDTDGLEVQDDVLDKAQTLDQNTSGAGINSVENSSSIAIITPADTQIKQEPSENPTYAIPTEEQRRMSDSKSPKLESPNINTINCPVFTSTPVSGSALFDISSTPQTSAKKPVKNYDVNTKRKPRYICNFCSYGTENYKTIHNHMYRHEPIKFQCPYCGFRRAPRSFVENHIRDVHVGQPIIVTEVVEEEPDLSSNSYRSNSVKRKEPSTPAALHPTLQKKLKLDTPTFNNKTSTKWPAPKSVPKVSISPPEMPPLQIPVKRKTPGSSISPIIPTITVPRPIIKSSGPPNVTISPPSLVPVQPSHLNSPPKTSCSPVIVPSEKPKQTVCQPNDEGAAIMPNETLLKPTFKEGSKTTFKTMYKCVFDPETCNHISKDRSKMKQHIFMHVEYKPWTCDYCNMTASQSSHVKNHVRAEHPEAEISFQYKRHNYLEKHIENFLQKGVFTVPVSEYRFIMDMKGSSKKQQYEYARDLEGFLLCPHCDYRTKSGGMADHVKMKHMQPRFKCHWCDFRAFYRSEVRKHHRKERGHAHLEFKTQELDLVEVMEEYKEGNGEIPDALQTTPLLHKSADIDSEIGSLNQEDMPDSSEIEDDVSSNADSVLSDSASLSNSMVDSARLPLNVPYSFETTDAAADSVRVKTETDLATNSQSISDTLSMNVESNVGVKSAEYKKAKMGTSNMQYKCAYCSFSAGLRTMVKLHCHKQHPFRKVHFIEQKSKSGETIESPNNNGSLTDENLNEKSLEVNDDSSPPCLKETENKTELRQTETLTVAAESFSKQNNTCVGIQKPVAKKGKNLKSVIDQLSCIAKQKVEHEVIKEQVNVANQTCADESTSYPCNTVKSLLHESLSDQHQIEPLGVHNHGTDSEQQPLSSSSTVEIPDSEVSPPVLTNEMCNVVSSPQVEERKECNATPPLLNIENDKQTEDLSEHAFTCLEKAQNESKQSVSEPIEPENVCPVSELERKGNDMSDSKISIEPQDIIPESGLEKKENDIHISDSMALGCPDGNIEACCATNDNVYLKENIVEVCKSITDWQTNVNGCKDVSTVIVNENKNDEDQVKMNCFTSPLEDIVKRCTVGPEINGNLDLPNKESSCECDSKDSGYDKAANKTESDMFSAKNIVKSSNKSQLTEIEANQEKLNDTAYNSEETGVEDLLVSKANIGHSLSHENESKNEPEGLAPS